MSERFRPGDVIRYDSERGDRHCREGMAIVPESGRPYDTFWLSGGDAHILTDAERQTASLLFNVGDYRELDRHQRYTWETYHSDDRQAVTSQHGLQRRLYVRHGATPDLGTQIENAREMVEKAEADVRSAENSLRWRREALAALIAVDVSTPDPDPTAPKPPESV